MSIGNHFYRTLRMAENLTYIYTGQPLLFTPCIPSSHELLPYGSSGSWSWRRGALPWGSPPPYSSKAPFWKGSAHRCPHVPSLISWPGRPYHNEGRGRTVQVEAGQPRAAPSHESSGPGDWNTLCCREHRYVSVPAYKQPHAALAFCRMPETCDKKSRGTRTPCGCPCAFATYNWS